LSAATAWELAIKVGQGKLALSIPYRQWMATAITNAEPENTRSIRSNTIERRISSLDSSKLLWREEFGITRSVNARTSHSRL
jgi:PIN domain nuclease of toxin-antitoxin system